jgi:hypothetical protein
VRCDIEARRNFLVAQAIAKEMNITVGEVKKFGSEGKITSDIVIKAIKGMNEVELGKLGTTLQSTAERVNAQRVAWNELSVTVGDVFVKASLPFIEVATKIAQGLTSVAKAAVDAPGPIKALAAAVVGLPAAYGAARLAVVAFNNDLLGGGMVKKARRRSSNNRRSTRPGIPSPTRRPRSAGSSSRSRRRRRGSRWGSSCRAPRG